MQKAHWPIEITEMTIHSGTHMNHEIRNWNISLTTREVRKTFRDEKDSIRRFRPNIPLAELTEYLDA